VSSTLLGSATDPLDAASASGPHEVSVRAFLANYAITLLVPLAGLVVLLTGWTITAAGGWPAAVAAVGIFAAGSAAWLHRRAWSPALVQLVTWAAPAALLMPSAILGRLSADALVLWAPVTTVLAVCLVLTHQPMPGTSRRRPRPVTRAGAPG
jgi:hypothetical protein